MEVSPNRKPLQRNASTQLQRWFGIGKPKEGIAEVFRDLTRLEAVAFSKCYGVGLAIEDEILAFLKANVPLTC